MAFHRKPIKWKSDQSGEESATFRITCNAAWWLTLHCATSVRATAPGFTSLCQPAFQRAFNVCLSLSYTLLFFKRNKRSVSPERIFFSFRRLIISTRLASSLYCTNQAECLWTCMKPSYREHFNGISWNIMYLGKKVCMQARVRCASAKVKGIKMKYFKEKESWSPSKQPRRIIID